MKLKGWIVIFLSACVAEAQNRPSKAPTPNTPATQRGAAAAQPKFKAIWERIPFDRDIGLRAVACTGPETCWAVGDKSTIIYTKDGGKMWEVQLGGDPASRDDGLIRVFFLDATHGWAMTARGK